MESVEACLTNKDNILQVPVLQFTHSDTVFQV